MGGVYQIVSTPSTTLRRLAKVALRAIRPETMLQQVLLPKPTGRVYVIGAGKATYGMAMALQRRLGKHIVGGYINVPVVYRKRIGQITVQKASHPFPDAATITATKKIHALLQSLTKDDLVIGLWSGGGSSLLTLPRPGLTLLNQIELSRQLMRAGANIIELNTVRKHLSQVKGGQLAALTKAKVMSLVISDVVGDRLDIIASGPTVADPTTGTQAVSILKKYHLYTQKLDRVIRQCETPKRLDVRRVKTKLIGSNRLALTAVYQTAKKLGLYPTIITASMHGEARVVARQLVRQAERVKRKPALLLAGGETTVTVRGTGYGGGNQELALAALHYLKPGMSLLTLATDGVDGFTPIPVAGAVVCYGQWSPSLQAYLSNNDSYTALGKLKALYQTGPTGTNVGDIVMILVT